MENPINILVVEDDTNINNLLKSALEKAGYQVIQAFSGTEAELVLQMQKSVSLVLLDLMLPGISGEEVLKSIREKGNLPVIVLTAKDSLDVFSKEDIFSYAWEEPYMGETKTLDVHISNIRKKLKAVTSEEYIETVWGIGYRLHG